jgi:Cu(I)/Ag(I) efflux system membrane protein CusA/SilA
MITRIIEWSARNVVLVLLATCASIAAGVYAVQMTPVDALPDLSDVQVIIYTEFPGQSPQVVEDQVTYPLTTAMLGVPRSRVVRGFSNFGVSFVYVIFDDDTDLYWARSRVLEYLGSVTARLPSGVSPTLGPDATGVGWVYEYVLTGAQHTLAELRSLQDWFVRPQLTQVHGVAEVASVGGAVQQYSIVLNPQRLRAYGVSLERIANAVRRSNSDVGARVLEMSETEYMIRGHGYLKGVADIEQIAVGAQGGTPVLLRDVARVELAPDERQGIAELDGQGEVVAGIAVARTGQNALDVIRGIKERLASLASALPSGVNVQAVYDRSLLIERAINTLQRTLLEESLIVALVCMLFLLHLRSALVAIVMLPVGVLLAFLSMRLLGLNSNIMSLGGIAIAIGAMVDAAIVMIENAHKHFERAAPGTSRSTLIVAACREVGPALFFSLLVITVSFLPVFALEAQEGRLFKPLAYTKTFSMAGAALLSITLAPVLMVLFIRGRVPKEQSNPLNRLLVGLYRPVIDGVLRRPSAAVVIAVLALLVSANPALRLGSEFMPTLNEGTLLFMPSSLPGLSITKAGELLQTQNRIIRGFPEVESVFGKAGRANSATDPAPTEMIETVINLKPQNQWRPGLTTDALIGEMNAALQLPGVANAWTMPIRARIDMLSTGIRTPLGVKVFGSDLAELERLAREIETVVRSVPGTTSAYAERLIGGYYLDIEPVPRELGRYGLTVGDLNDTISMALGGELLTTTVEGRQRYGVIARYPRELRDSPQTIARELLVTTADGAQIPLGQVARLSISRGAPSIRTENALLAAYVYVDLQGRDIGSYVADAKQALAAKVKMPPGYYVAWSGQFEYFERAAAKLKIVIPITLISIFLLLYLHFRRISETLIVMLTLPFALLGGVWLLWLLGYNLSVATAVGFIALAGVAAETGVVMLLYLDQALAQVRARCEIEGRALTRSDLREAIRGGAVDRVRPKMMTVVTIIAGLLPIMWGSGTGSEVMRRIAAPMVGGMLSSALLTLVVIPAVYALVYGRRLKD